MKTVLSRLPLVLTSLIVLGLTAACCDHGEAAVIDPPADCEEIVFAQRVSGNDHWYGNFGHYCETESPYTDRMSRVIVGPATNRVRFVLGRASR